MKRRDERQKDLEDKNVGQGEEAHGAMRLLDCAFVFVEGLKNSERPAEALAHQAVGVHGGFGKGKGLVFVDDAVALLEQVHGEVGVFGDGVGVISIACA